MILKKSDKALIKRFLTKKDPNAFTKLYDRYSDKVYGRCLQFFQNEEKAKDATQEIFIKILYKLDSIKEQEYFSTWLYSVTYRYCIDIYRKGKKDFFVKDDIPLYSVYYEEDDTLFDEFYSNTLEMGLKKLDQEERTILLMKYMDELSVKEISETLEISLSAVKMRIKRSRDKLIQICTILTNQNN